MILLNHSLPCWGSASFSDSIKSEIEQLNADQLPLQAGLSQSSYISEDPFRVMIINTTGTEHCIQVRAGIFYTGIIAGCNCSDDPTPVDTLPEYCEVDFEINITSGETNVVLVSG